MTENGIMMNLVPVLILWASITNDGRVSLTAVLRECIVHTFDESSNMLLIKRNRIHLLNQLSGQ